MKMKNILTLIFGILIISNVTAFAVSSQYWDDNPIIMEKGETKQIKIYLQNMAGKETITATGSILEGADIARFISDPKYTIAAGTKSEIIIEIKIPRNIPIINDYIKLAFETTSGEGAFALKNSVERTIPISIEEKPKDITLKNTLWYVIIIATIVIIILIILLLKKKKKKKRK